MSLAEFGTARRIIRRVIDNGGSAGDAALAVTVETPVAVELLSLPGSDCYFRFTLGAHTGWDVVTSEPAEPS